MTQQEQNTSNYGKFAAALVVCAVICRVLGKTGVHDTLFALIRTVIYIGLYIGWGIMFAKRVVQTPVRRILAAVTFLTVFWFTVRSVKYCFTEDPWLARQLWYSYYIPMLLIPLAALFVALLLGKPEDYPLPGRVRLLYIPAALCILLVLTNDLHQLVFSFPAGEVWTDSNKSYEPGYYVAMGWAIGCALAAFTIMAFKCRLSQRRKYLPFIPLACSVVYTLLYASGIDWLQIIAGDITAAQCLMFTAVLESCIQCGLIQTNTGYGRLFGIGTIGAQIADADYSIRYASSNAIPLSREQMRAAESGGVSIDGSTLLKSSPISGGHVLWQEDITDISALLERLEENRKAIEESNCIEEENYRTRAKINALREKNRLYDRLQKQTAGQVDLLDRLLTQYEQASGPEAARALLAKIGVVGAYIKRRGNMIFVEEKSAVTDTAELAACLDESFTGLRFMGVDCALDIPAGQSITVGDADRVYDFFEAVTEAALDDLRSVWLKGRVFEHEIAFYLETESGADLSQPAQAADACTLEDGVWRFTVRVRKAGGAA